MAPAQERFSPTFFGIFRFGENGKDSGPEPTASPRPKVAAPGTGAARPKSPRAACRRAPKLYAPKDAFATKRRYAFFSDLLVLHKRPSKRAPLRQSHYGRTADERSRPGVVMVTSNHASNSEHQQRTPRANTHSEHPQRAPQRTPQRTSQRTPTGDHVQRIQDPAKHPPGLEALYRTLSCTSCLGST